MTGEEDVTAQLLRLAGAPQDPPAERGARVREAVHREWRSDHRRRVVRRSVIVAALGVAATVMIAVLEYRPAPPSVTARQLAATGQRVQGQPQIVTQSQPAVSQPLTLSSSIYTGDMIQTDAGSRLALLAVDGSSVRIDTDSRLRFLAPDTIEVIAGTAYVATSTGSHGFQVRTTLGVVRDLGTQFEVRLLTSALRLRVRSGRVEIGRGASITTAEAGTEATVTTTGVTVRQMPSFGSEWAWTADIAPAFAIEGRMLGAFLEHLANEEGWTLRYADATIADSAARTVLHGSVDGLKPEEALAATLVTSGLQYRLRDGEVLVSRAPSER